MGVVARLLTLVDLADADDDGPDARRMSVSARLEAVLADGRRVVLLDDRGWNVQMSTGTAHGVWAHQTVESMEQSARAVVGPDGAFGNRTEADMAAAHWGALADDLRRQGVDVDAAELKALPHDVELSERVRARIGGRT